MTPPPSSSTSGNVLLLLSGPNLNLLGTREPTIYGTATLDDHVASAQQTAGDRGYALEHLQSNSEQTIVDAIHSARSHYAGIIINPGAFTHYAWAIADALSAYSGPSWNFTSPTPKPVSRGATLPSCLRSRWAPSLDLAGLATL